MKKGLLATGLLVTAFALAWWWRTYGEVVTYGYLSWPEAGRCLVRDSDLCMLAKALCLGSHPRTFLLYWTSAFWGGVALLSCGFLLGRGAPYRSLKV